MFACKRDLFDLEDSSAYLNCALMAPLLKTTIAAGMEGVKKKARPYQLTGDDFFVHADNVRKEFSKLINAADYERIALLPSVSYGMAIIERNLKLEKGENLVTVGEAFPSNMYPWIKLTQRYQADLKVITAPGVTGNRGKVWNEKILEAIDNKTRAVCIGNVHWTCGTLYDLEAIGKKAKEAGALLIIDASQSIGSLRFDAQKIKPDALITAGWKWLFGPYSTALGYFSAYFDNCETLEDNWINRVESDHFDRILYYQDNFRPKAQKYNVGEFSNFILIPMLLDSLKMINEWGVDNIQNYCRDLIAPYINAFFDLGCWIEQEKYRGSHLFGVKLPENVSINNLKAALHERKITVSVRGEFIRVSPNVYNTPAEIERLLDTLKSVITVKGSTTHKNVQYGLH